MKILTRIIAVCAAFFILGLSSAYSQNQAGDGYTMLGTPSGQQVCLGRWVPPTDVALPGVCEGRLVDVAQFTAMSAKMSADRLDQLIMILESIDQKMAVNNDQITKLIEATVKTQTSIDHQVNQTGEILQETIIERFDALSEDLLNNDKFRQELAKLKEEILRDVEKRYPTPTIPAKK